MQKSIFIYARYSTDQQKEETIEAQIAACEDYARKHGWTIIDRFHDSAISGTSFKSRPGITRMLERIKRETVDIVLCTALDRLTRDPEHSARIYKLLKHHRVELHTTHGGQPTDLEVAIRAALNAEFVAETARKTRDGMRNTVRKGKAAAGLAYGYKVKLVYDDQGERIPGFREIDKDEAPIVVRIFTEYAAGRSPQEIASGLNADGIPGPRGAAWRDTAIRGHRTRGTGILNNEMYNGRMIWNRQSFTKNPETERRLARMNDEDVWEVREIPELRIVPVELWNKVKQRQADVEKLFSHTTTNSLNRYHRPQYMLSGLLECAVCGGPYAILAKDRYGCTNHKKKIPLAELHGMPCPNSRSIMRSELERRVTAAFPESIFAASSIADIQRDVTKELKERTKDRNKARSDLERGMKATETKMRNIINAISENRYVPMMDEMLKELDEQRKEQAAAISNLPHEEHIEIPALVLSPDMLRTSIRAVCQFSLKDQKSELHQAWINMGRSLVQRVIVTPRDPKGVSLEVHGRLATILASIAAWNREEKRIKAEQREEFVKRREAGALKTRQDRIAFMQGVERELQAKRRSWERLQVSVVAGVGFEPTTFRL